MRVIPGGSFTIGSPATEPHHRSNEGPQRAVQIAAFAVSELEITRGQYAMFAADTQRGTPQGCQIVSAKHDGTYATDERASWRDAGYPQGDDHPVVCVAWQDAVDYAAWLSRRTGLRYRLLGDAEWEYAARGGATSAYFWGDDRELGCGYANGCDQSLQRVFPSWPGTFASCDDGAVYTAPAGHYRPNAFGLFDMIGNVREWVADCAEPVDGPPGDGAGCALRDVRGGSWDDDPEDLRAARRQHVRPERRSYDLGFRVARDWP